MKVLKASHERDDGEVLEHTMAEVAAAIADPSRVSMLCALMDGRAWTATELSAVADIAPSTASAHLNKLLNGRLISCLSQGRHRYYRLAGREIASLLETLMGVSMVRAPQVKTNAPHQTQRSLWLSGLERATNASWRQRRRRAAEGLRTKWLD